MDIAIPVAPAGVIILVNFFAPYLVSLISAPWWPKSAKKWVSIGVSILLAGLVLIIYFVGFHVAVPAWPSLLLLGVVVTQFAYGIILKDSADIVENTSGTGATVPAAIVSSAPAPAAEPAPLITSTSTPPAPSTPAVAAPAPAPAIVVDSFAPATTPATTPDAAPATAPTE